MQSISKYLLLILICFFCNACGELQPASTSAQQQPQESAPPATEEVSINDRTSWQKPTLILDKLGDLSDKTVADIGAGTGYFSFQLVHRAQKVIAIEIDSNLINLINAFRSTMSEEKQAKMEARLALTDDPMLKIGEADVALFVNVIPYIENRVDYLTSLRKNLAENGRLMIVDFKVKRLPIDAPPYNERVVMHIIEEELYQAGFSTVEVDDSTLDFQYIITAQ